MIDINFLRNNPEVVKENIKKKFQMHKIAYVDTVLELDERNRDLKKEGDDLRAMRNKLSGEIGKLMREKRVNEANELKQQVVNNNGRIAEI